MKSLEKNSRLKVAGLLQRYALRKDIQGIISQQCLASKAWNLSEFFIYTSLRAKRGNPAAFSPLMILSQEVKSFSTSTKPFALNKLITL